VLSPFLQTVEKKVALTKRAMIETCIPLVRAEDMEDINVHIHLVNKVRSLFGVSVSYGYAARIWDSFCWAYRANSKRLTIAAEKVVDNS
jgi:hypothetical protein